MSFAQDCLFWRPSFEHFQYILTWSIRDDEKSLVRSDFVFSWLAWIAYSTLCFCIVFFLWSWMLFVNDVFWFLWISNTGIFSLKKKQFKHHCIITNLKICELSHIWKPSIWKPFMNSCASSYVLSYLLNDSFSLQCNTRLHLHNKKNCI